MSSDVRVGIIGTRWGLMHVGGFRAAGARVVALCGRDADHTRRVAAREGIEIATADVPALCREVDLVVVASPDAVHAEHATAALDAGRAVLCEKPMAIAESEAEAMAARARAASRPAFVSFPYRMLQPLADLERWLADRPVRQIVATVRNGFAADGAGASGDFGGVSHVVDAALWLSGDHPAWVQAALSGRPAHSVALQIGTTSGAVLAIQHVASPEPGIHGGWSIVGDGWEAGFSASYVPAREGWCISPVRAFEHGRWHDVARGAEPHRGAREPWAEAHVETARHVLAALDGLPATRLASFDDGLAVQRVLAAAARADERGRRIPIG